MKTERVYLLGEGKTEKLVLKALDFYGEFQVFNMWTHKARKILPKLNRAATLRIFIDADRSETEVERQICAENLLNFERAGYVVQVYLQVQNLEDELARACGSNIYQDFAVHKGSSELKNKMIECTNLKDRLLRLGLDKTKMWQQPHSVCDELFKQYRQI